MSQPPYIITNARFVTLTKLDAATGRIEWMRHLIPPFWPRSRNAGNVIAGAADALQVSAIHGTNDVAVRVTGFGVAAPTNCYHAVARVTPCGCVEWWRHIHLAAPQAVPNDMVTDSSGDTIISEGSNALEVLNTAGQPTFYTNVDTPPTYLGSATPGALTLWHCPGRDQFITQAGYVDGTTQYRLRTPTTAAWARFYVTTILSTMLTVSDNYFATFEQWFPLSPTDRRYGLVVRSLAGGSYTLPDLFPPQFDIVANTMTATFKTAAGAAAFGDSFYWFHNDGTARLMKTDHLLNETWSISPITGIGSDQMVADANGLMCLMPAVASVWNGRNLMLVKYAAANGSIVWKQSLGLSGNVQQICLSDNGSLYVASTAVRV